MGYKFNAITGQLDLVGSSGGGSTPVDVTKAELLTLIGSSGLSVGGKYSVTSPNYSGTILVDAIDVDKVSSDGIWIKNTDLYAFGWFKIAGSSGSVSSVKVNGVELLSGTVNFNTDIYTTARGIRNNINGAGGAYSAAAINDLVILVQNVAGAAANGHVITTTSSTIVVSNKQSITNGIAVTEIALNVKYNPATDTIYYVADQYGNVLDYTEEYMTNNGIYPFDISSFRWGDSTWSKNIISNSGVPSSVFAVTGLTNLKLSGGSSFFNVAGNLFNNITLEKAASFSSNYAIGSDNFSNILISGSTSNMTSNQVTTSTGTDIKEIQIRGTFSQVNSNIISNGGTLRNLTINGSGIEINENIISCDDGGIKDILININTFYIDRNVISGTCGGIFNCKFNGSGAVSDLTLSTDLQNFTEVEWTVDNRVIYNILRSGLSNTANNGANASLIYLGWLPYQKMYFWEGTIEGSADLAGASTPQISFGIETDGATTILSNTLVSTLVGSAKECSLGALTGSGFVKSTVANRRIVANLPIGNLTAGSIRASLVFKISTF